MVNIQRKSGLLTDQVQEAYPWRRIGLTIHKGSKEYV